MLMEWGQFLAHDVVGTPVGELLAVVVGVEVEELLTLA